VFVSVIGAHVVGEDDCSDNDEQYENDEDAHYSLPPHSSHNVSSIQQMCSITHLPS
jgi:hypothetical protein